MKKHLLFYILSYSFFVSSGQNYELIKTNEIQYFKVDSGYDEGLIYAIQSDSFQFNGQDTVFYLNKSPYYYTDFEYGMVYYKGPSWLGSQITKTSKGKYILRMQYQFEKNFPDINFYNIEIQTNIWSHDTFQMTFMSHFKNLYYSFIKADTASILGIKDSVKIYSVFDDYSSDYLIVSKHNGIVKFPRIIAPWDAGGNLVRVKERHLTFMDIYSFNVGDVFHIQKKPHSNAPWICHRIQTITNKWLSTDLKSLHIAMNIKEYYTNLISLETQVYETDTQLNISNPYSFVFNELPRQSIIKKNIFDTNQFFCGCYSQRSSQKIYNGLTVLAEENRICDTSFTTKTNYYFTNIYIEGCGQLKNLTKVDESGDFGSEEKLIYYKKGSEEWGTPFHPLNISEMKEDNEQLLYPNPSTGLFQLNTILSNTNLLQLSVFNLHGQLLKEINLLKTEDIAKVDLSFLNNGVFFVKIKSDNSEKFQKIILIK